MATRPTKAVKGSKGSKAPGAPSRQTPARAPAPAQGTRAQGTRAQGAQQATRAQGARAQGAQPSARPQQAARAEEPARPPRPARPGPSPLRVAAIALAVEALGLCLAAVFAVVSTANGRSYQESSGVALTLIALGAAAALSALSMGVAKAKPWSRTPAVMAQLFVGGAGIYLLDGHRYEWGVPALLIAASCLAGILAPSSLRALNRPGKPFDQ